MQKTELFACLKKGVLSAVGVATSHVMPNQACRIYFWQRTFCLKLYFDRIALHTCKHFVIWLKTNIRHWVPFMRSEVYVLSEADWSSTEVRTGTENGKLLPFDVDFECRWDQYSSDGLWENLYSSRSGNSRRTRTWGDLDVGVWRVFSTRCHFSQSLLPVHRCFAQAGTMTRTLSARCIQWWAVKVSRVSGSSRRLPPPWQNVWGIIYQNLRMVNTLRTAYPLPQINNGFARLNYFAIIYVTVII
jgi:hypothetical protein